MHPTVAQNQAHRADIAWIKTSGRKFAASNGESYISEYLNPWTGQAIRKSWRMTSSDWHLFNAAGEFVSQAHSLTVAKHNAEDAR